MPSQHEVIPLPLHSQHGALPLWNSLIRPLPLHSGQRIDFDPYL